MIGVGDRHPTPLPLPLPHAAKTQKDMKEKMRTYRMWNERTGSRRTQTLLARPVTKPRSRSLQLLR